MWYNTFFLLLAKENQILLHNSVENQPYSNFETHEMHLYWLHFWNKQRLEITAIMPPIKKIMPVEKQS